MVYNRYLILKILFATEVIPLLRLLFQIVYDKLILERITLNLKKNKLKKEKIKQKLGE